jgi:hypothetical protein
VDISDQSAVEQRFGFDPEVVAGFALALGVGDQGRDQLKDVFFRVDIRERIVMERLFEVDRVEDFDAVSIFQQCVAALNDDAAFGEENVKV